MNRTVFLELMPELEGLELRFDELKGGITNRLYRVRSSDGHDLVVRQYGRKTELFIDRDVETENIRRLASSGVTPKLVKFIPERRATIVEYIPGYVMKNADFLIESLWEKIVRPLRIIHGSGASLPVVFDPIVQVKRLHRVFEGLDIAYPEFEIDNTIVTLEKISEKTGFASARLVPCHNDLLADNFILVEDREKYREPMYLIDWEYAGMNTPHYDIADMFQDILVPRETEACILKAYWEDRDMDRNTYLTDLFKPFPDIFWFFWSLIQLNVSTIDFDFYTYGKVRYDNAQKNIRYLKDHYSVRLP